MYNSLLWCNVNFLSQLITQLICMDNFSTGVSRSFWILIRKFILLRVGIPVGLTVGNRREGVVVSRSSHRWQDEFWVLSRNWHVLIDKGGIETIVFARGSADLTMATPTNSSGNLVDEFEESFQVEFYIPYGH